MGIFLDSYIGLLDSLGVSMCIATIYIYSWLDIRIYPTGYWDITYGYIILIYHWPRQFGRGLSEKQNGIMYCKICQRKKHIYNLLDARMHCGGFSDILFGCIIGRGSLVEVSLRSRTASHVTEFAKITSNITGYLFYIGVVDHWTFICHC